MMKTANPAQDNSLPRERETDVCWHCSKKLSGDYDKFYAYWSPHLIRRVHKECKQAAVLEDRIDCQSLDANCNDCFFFTREKPLAKGVDLGKCTKFGTQVKAVPNTFQGNPCFKHRKLI